MQEQILAWLAAHLGCHHHEAVQQGLGFPSTVRYILYKMTDTGLVAILLPGIYELPHHAAVSRLPQTEGRPQRDNGARRG